MVAVIVLAFFSSTVAALLFRRVRENAAHLRQIAFTDQETGLPNGLQLDADMGTWDSLPTEKREASLVMVGFRLKGLGVSFSIDGIPLDEKNSKIVQAILHMARSFSMSVVAEGVEYQEQRDFLAVLGSDQIQGYFYSKPLTSDDALQFLKTKV